MPETEEATIRAAGAALWRYRAGTLDLELAVVHRPRYDDWSLPKGKADRGETIAATAVREIREETGISAVLGRWLGTVRYPVPDRDGGTARKVVDYFSAGAGDGAFEPNAEVDELRWVSPAAASELLTYRWDHDIIARFTALPADQSTLLLVRHAKAGKRSEWTGDDRLRPLTESGRQQAAALRALLPLYGADRVHSVPLVRCEQTVLDVATDLGVELIPESLLSEENYWPEPGRGLRRLAEIVRAGGTPVVCGQGGVIPDLVGKLAHSGQVDLSEPASRKGSLWVLSFDPSARTDHAGPVRLLAADYVPDPTA